MNPSLIADDSASPAAGPLAAPSDRPKRKSRARPGSLKAWRVARGINQRLAAAALGLTQAKYSRLEREVTFAKPKLAQRLSVLTDVALEVLLGLHR